MAEPAAASPPMPPLSSVPACGNCGEPMDVLQLAGHYDRPVEIDLCTGCHLVWFDPIESARLGGPAMLALIGRMAQAQSLAHRTLTAKPACPRCRGALRTVHNHSRWGRSLQLECALAHGAYQTFAEFLQEKGLLRRDGHLYCVNCGSSVGATDQRCGHCQSMDGCTSRPVIRRRALGSRFRVTAVVKSPAQQRHQRPVSKVLLT